MADITVTFLHPIDMHPLEVDIDDSMTAQEAVDELINAQFITNSQGGYRLSEKGGNEIDADQSFNAAGVKDDGTLIVAPQTDAGHF